MPETKTQGGEKGVSGGERRVRGREERGREGGDGKEMVEASDGDQSLVRRQRQAVEQAPTVGAAKCPNVRPNRIHPAYVRCQTDSFGGQHTGIDV